MNARLIATLSFILFLGAGCFGFGGGKSDGSRDGAVFGSTDSGVTWTQSAAFPTTKGVGSLAAMDLLTIVIDPSDRYTLYMGTKENGLFYSLNGGSAWQQPRDQALQQGAVRSIAIDPADVCTVYAVTATKLYKTETCARNFQAGYEETRGNVALRRVVVDWFNPDVVYLGLSNGDLLKSSDRGEAWTKILSVVDDVRDILISNADSRIILIATSSGLYKTVDGGITWEKQTDALKDYKEADNIFSLVQTTAGDVMFLSAKYGLLRSMDAGESWEALSLVTSPGQVTIRAFAVDPGNANTMYYATASTFYTSRDGGVTWETSKLPTTRAASALRVDPEKTSTLYLGVQRLEP
jgi:photosystem II stability/assembly factor-like uncharacterized protein